MVIFDTQQRFVFGAMTQFLCVGRGEVQIAGQELFVSHTIVCGSAQQIS